MERFQTDVTIRRLRLQKLLKSEEIILKQELESHKLSGSERIEHLQAKVLKLRELIEADKKHFEEQSQMSRYSIPKSKEESQLEYSQGLAEQIEQKAEALARLKREEALAHSQLHNYNSRFDEEELKKQQSKMLEAKTYMNSLREQLAENEERRKLEAQQMKEDSKAYVKPLDVTGNSKYADQRRLKETLDLMVEEKTERMNREAEDCRDFKEGNIMKNLCTSEERQKHENMKKEKLLQDQKSHLEYTQQYRRNRNQQSLLMEELDRQEALLLNEREDKERQNLADAQNKLKMDAIQSWNERKVELNDLKKMEDLKITQEAESVKKITDDFQLQESLRKEKQREKNKQYQNDLLEQINAKKKLQF